MLASSRVTLKKLTAKENPASCHNLPRGKAGTPDNIPIQQGSDMGACCKSVALVEQSAIKPPSGEVV